ncbi:MAG TPA: hypothetical protein VGI81_23895 [Tepidisphaeraceae bacterium]|jgi:hypothetical protein
MNALSMFGLVAVSLMLVFYALEDRSPWFILAFAGACLLAASYGFLQGAWPFGIVEAIWSVVAMLNWLKKRRPADVEWFRPFRACHGDELAPACVKELRYDNDDNNIPSD